MRTPRPAARILLVDAQDRVLMFRFTPDDRPPRSEVPPGGIRGIYAARWVLGDGPGSATASSAGRMGRRTVKVEP